MKLLWVFSTFAIGGPQRRFATLAKVFGRDFSHDIVAMDGRYEAAEFLSDHSEWRIRKLKVQKSSLVSWSNLGRFRETLAELKPDLVLTSNWGTVEWLIVNRGKSRRPHIHFEDGFGPDESPERQNPKRAFARSILLKRRITVVPSRTLHEVACKSWRLPDENVVLIPNGIDVARFAGAERAAGSNVVVGSLGALRPEKNYRRLVRTFAAASKGGAMRLMISGEGPERAAIEAEAKALGARIELPGVSTQPERALTGFDIFALSSDTEQMPLSLMEAMASGLPVVATDVGDVAAMVSEQNRAFIVPPGDESAFAAALEKLAGDSELRRRLGRMNAGKAKREFGLDAMVAAHRALYRRVAGP